MGQKLEKSSLHNFNDVTKLKKIIRSKNADINNIADCATALFKAVKENREEIVTLLLQHNADPNILCGVKRKNGYIFTWTAIHEACRQNMTDTLKALLEHGGNVNLQVHDMNMMTPLHVAACHSRRETVQLLIEAGCDVNLNNKYHESALVVAICNGDSEIVEVLLNAGCKMNSRAWDNMRKMAGKYDIEYRDTLIGDGPCSLLTLAIKYAWLSVACIILKHGFNPNVYQLHNLVLLVKHKVGVLDERFKVFITTLLAAGYRYSNDTLIKLDYSLCPHTTSISEELLDWVKKQYVPPNLQQTCRSEIRRCLRVHCAQSSIIASIYQLDLPKSLKDYLALSDMVEFEEDMSASDMMPSAEREPLYLAMPRMISQPRSKKQVYLQFWKQSCCCQK